MHCWMVRDLSALLNVAYAYELSYVYGDRAAWLTLNRMTTSNVCVHRFLASVQICITHRYSPTVIHFLRWQFANYDQFLCRSRRCFMSFRHYCAFLGTRCEVNLQKIKVKNMQWIALNHGKCENIRHYIVNTDVNSRLAERYKRLGE